MRCPMGRSWQLVKAVSAPPSGCFRRSWARGAYTGSCLKENQNVLGAYQDLVETGRLKPDQRQYYCARRFQALFDELSRYAPAVSRYEEEISSYMQKRREVRQRLAAREDERVKAKGGWFDLRWISKIGQERTSSADRIMKEAREREHAIDTIVGSPPTAPPAPRGIYLHGNVGSGKTMLMDLFFNTVSKANMVPKVRRVHFNDAMDELHRRMHRLELERAMLDVKQNQAFLQSVAAHEHQSMPTATDPVAAKQKSMQQAKLATRRLRSQLQKRPSSRASMGTSLILAKATLSLIKGNEDINLGWDSSSRTASLLCFDELQVGDPFSAIAVKGMLEALLEQGTVIVCTSNAPITQLNRHGSHEDLFTDFQERMLATCDEVELSASQDYRLSFGQAIFQEVGGLSWRAGCNYYCPLDAASAEALENAWQHLLQGHSEMTELLHLNYGRKLLVSRAGPGVARFSFKELCGLPLGLPEYQGIARSFKQGVLISEVPRFSLQMRDQARRFITLVDELYNAKTPLFISADAWPMELFMKPGDTPVLDLEGLQFETAIAGTKLRRDLLAHGDVGALEETNTALSAAKSQNSGITEQFAFARAVSRLFELTQEKALHMCAS